MKILFVADGRSPTALNWIRYLSAKGHRIHLVSMFPCKIDFEVDSLTVIPVIFSGMVPGKFQNGNLKTQIIRSIATPRVRTWLRHLLIPNRLPTAADQLKSLVARIKPDIIHAMRLPYEGMLAGMAQSIENTKNPPLLVSIWGNDFTLHATATKKLAKLTKETLAVADALHTDCYRDRILAETWGFDLRKPSVVLPGAGGIQLDTFYPPEVEPGMIVINPRGLRTYIRNDIFFKAAKIVWEVHPSVRFLCPDMKGKPGAERMVERGGLREVVDLLARQQRFEMADLYRKSRVVVSPSVHDGTPNTLLEAMACGCIPVAGDLESIREWITPEVNGLLCDPRDPLELANAISKGLHDRSLHKQAMDVNTEMIKEKAEHAAVMGKAVGFYEQLLNR